MALKKLKIVLSFDHELSLGSASSYEKNLFDPTDRLFELAAELNVPIALFTDVCCATRFHEWDRTGFFEPYQRQIRKALEQGHDVQLHLHPHWLDSEFRNGTYAPSSSYTLSSFYDRSPPNNIPGIVAQGIEFLHEVCRPVQPDYRCVAYRGGGYNLAPRTAEILTALYDHGIRIDSSISKGMRRQTVTNSIDYRHMPWAANWMISPEGPLNDPVSSGILEVPIAARPRTPLNNLPFLVGRVIHRRRAHKSHGRGIITEQSTSRQRLARLFPRSVWTLSFDTHVQGVGHLMRTLRSHVLQHQDDEQIMCSACSHPKAMGSYQRSLMRAFVEKARHEYGQVVQFVTFRRIYDDLFGETSGDAE